MDWSRVDNIFAIIAHGAILLASGTLGYLGTLPLVRTTEYLRHHLHEARKNARDVFFPDAANRLQSANWDEIELPQKIAAAKQVTQNAQWTAEAAAQYGQFHQSYFEKLVDKLKELGATDLTYREMMHLPPGVRIPVRPVRNSFFASSKNVTAEHAALYSQQLGRMRDAHVTSGAGLDRLAEMEHKYSELPKRDIGQVDFSMEVMSTGKMRDVDEFYDNSWRLYPDTHEDEVRSLNLEDKQREVIATAALGHKLKPSRLRKGASTPAAETNGATSQHRRRLFRRARPTR
jgi:hypothetical protein